MASQSISTFCGHSLWKNKFPWQSVHELGDVGNILGIFIGHHGINIPPSLFPSYFEISETMQAQAKIHRYST